MAALSFGFWVALFDHRYEALWVKALHRAFRPDGPRLRKHVSARLSELRLLRNRVAHHDSLQRVAIDTQHEHMLELARWPDPAAGVFLRETTPVTDFLSRRP